MNDIKNKEDIELLINKFYSKVILDDLIGQIFTQVIKFSWDKHIPIMISFWNTLLFGVGDYKGNPMLKHIDLNKIFPLNADHFERWISLWQQTINENFFGTIANEAIIKAQNIANLMQYKIAKSIV